MKTTYVPHLFGDAAQAKLTSRQGWLTAGEGLQAARESGMSYYSAVIKDMLSAE
jgi:hypothetical protein